MTDKNVAYIDGDPISRDRFEEVYDKDENAAQANIWTTKELGRQYFQDREDAKRWRKVISLTQKVPVKLWQDGDKTPFIKIGETSHWNPNGDFNSLIDSIAEPNA